MGSTKQKYTKVCKFYFVMRISGMRRFFDHIVISTSNRCESSRQLSTFFYQILRWSWSIVHRFNLCWYLSPYSEINLFPMFICRLGNLSKYNYKAGVKSYIPILPRELNVQLTCTSS
jgi:hypothetical protein